jgi:hypothetical protein
MDSFRWLTVSPPEQPDLEIILGYPGPPMLDPESGEAVKTLLRKGALGGGVFQTPDCRRAFEELGAAGVQFLQEPTQRDYGLEATFRDNSGTWFSMTERPSG